MHLEDVSCRVGGTRTQHSADGHGRAPVGEIRDREREYEQGRTVDAQLWVSRDHGDDENVRDNVEGCHCNDDRGLDGTAELEIHVSPVMRTSL